ncbi:MAG: hypothetical protein IID53_14490 [Proteobacteria bacterium]|nr:hypothetical protein [Pseudomonadota bacterium]
MLMRHTALILFSGLFIAASALAQDGTGSGETEAPPPAAVGETGAGTSGTTEVTAGSFGELSPGNHKIADSLFTAQPEMAPEGSTLMTQDQIADLKASGMGWGQIFKKMQADGLTTTRNLGQAVSSFNHQQKNATTTGTGETGGDGTSGSGTTGTTGDPGTAGTAVETTDHFDQLSTGNQKIAEAIQAAQTDPATGFTVDEIAMLKQDGMGWGQVFKQTDSTVKNLGQAVSGQKHGEFGISPGSEFVVTTGTGQRIIVGGKKKSSAATASSANGKTKSKGHKSGSSKGVHVTTAGGGQGPVSTGKGAGKSRVTSGHGSSSSGIVTGAGAGASSSGVIHGGGGGGNAYGHAKAGKTGK